MRKYWITTEEKRTKTDPNRLETYIEKHVDEIVGKEMEKKRVLTRCWQFKKKKYKKNSRLWSNSTSTQMR